MSEKKIWCSTEGRTALKTIVAKLVPKWPNGLRTEQEEPVLRILDGEDLLLTTATGRGKSALFIVPLLVHREVASNPTHYAGFSCKSTPVGLVITPTKGLASNIVAQLGDFGLQGLTYCQETISVAAIAHRNLTQEIKDRRYHLICIDPEHLIGHIWMLVFRCNLFVDSLVFTCLEECHLADEWGKSFRKAFQHIGAFIRGRVPSTVSLFGISATLEPGRQTLAILPFLNTGRKAIVFCLARQTCTKLYEYLFRREPPGANHGRRVRVYTAICPDDFNRETLRLMDTDPYLQIIVGTVAAANGVHCASIQDAYSIGMPDTLSQMNQQAGRAARVDGEVGRAVVFYQKSDLRTAQKTLEGVSVV
ncbi:P-loop containing nucleoside triphosphate hydrolase protein [Cylindrobasidium torrendii FP15055 ss-10]|uniref:DNA 3'-5' helicase n=1 Tax=Cylindrobasidium torrendii FP15055 ss-10 TaxID=1314674 RepID=A0A0D7B675_9AGAR|nr:P-loop containing nucleoside triphosphate hydrolase protein [Cylindrobasidium torrendii FP15055 ss-10]